MRSAFLVLTVTASMSLAIGVGSVSGAAYPVPRASDTTCVVVALPVPKASKADSPIIGQGCFASDEAADAFAALTVQRWNSASDQAVAAASVTIGSMWTGTSFSGQKLNFVAPAGCTTSSDYRYPSFQAPWNNNFESGISLAGCVGIIYDTASFGTFLGSFGVVSDFAAGANRASSARFTG